MKSLVPEVQVSLQQAYIELADLYENALTVSTALPAAFDAGTHADGELQQLAEIMSRIGRVEKDLAPLKQQWQATGQRSTPELRISVDRVQKSLVALIASISSAEQHAQAARKKLSPRLNAETISQRMRAAYAAGSYM